MPLPRTESTLFPRCSKDEKNVPPRRIFPLCKTDTRKSTTLNISVLIFLRQRSVAILCFTSKTSFPVITSFIRNFNTENHKMILVVKSCLVCIIKPGAGEVCPILLSGRTPPKDLRVKISICNEMNSIFTGYLTLLE